MSAAVLIADSLVSLFALIGLCFVVSFLLRRSKSDGLTIRLVFALAVLALMLAARLASWLNGAGIFQLLTLMAASLVPLAVLIVTEGMLRRHAPPFAKWFALISSGALILLAPFPDGAVEPWRSTLLLGAQASACVLAGWMIFARDRRDLSAAENPTVDRMALSFLLILPLLATEFRDLADWPVRLGGIAILALCWLSLNAGNPDSSNRMTLLMLAVVFTLSLAVGIGAGSISGVAWQDQMRATAIVMAGALLTIVIYDWLRLRAAARRSGLINHLAFAPDAAPDIFLKSIKAYPAMEGAILLRDSDLSDFDEALLDAAFQGQPVIWNEDLATSSGFDPDTHGQLQSLFRRYDATQIMLLSFEPRWLAAINASSLAVSPQARAELAALQRMTALMGKAGAAT